jgi:hypothetical protein
LGVTLGAGDSVSSWQEQISLTNLLPYDANKFTWLDAQVNGEPALRGYAACYFVANSWLSYFQGEDTPLTFFVVYKVMEKTADNLCIWAGKTGSSYPWKYFRHWGQGGGQQDGYYIYDDTNLETHTLGSPNIQKDWQSTIVRVNGTTVDMWINNNQVVTSASLNVGACNNLDFFRVGQPGSEDGNFIAEIGIQNSAISGSDVTKLLDYLKARYTLWS